MAGLFLPLHSDSCIFSLWTLTWMKWWYLAIWSLSILSLDYLRFGLQAVSCLFTFHLRSHLSIGFTSGLGIRQYIALLPSAFRLTSRSLIVRLMLPSVTLLSYAGNKLPPPRKKDARPRARAMSGVGNQINGGEKKENKKRRGGVSGRHGMDHHSHASRRGP